MKRIFTIFCMAFMPLFASSVFAQDTIVAWTFPSGSADSLVDKAISINSTRYISCQYGTSGPLYVKIPIDYTTNGYLGSPDKCAKATNWDNGVDSTSWMVKMKTTGYDNLVLYSRMQSGNTNPGPRDFIVQWKVSGSTVWTDLLLDTLVCANDWASAFVNGVSLPAACNNMSSGSVSIRWVVISTLDINGTTLLSTGLNKIDNIVVTGTPVTGIQEAASVSPVTIYPNPNTGSFCIENDEDINKIAVYNILGKCVYTNESIIGDRTMLTGFDKGMYIIQITTKDNIVSSHKIIVD
jgi:hypothetical protein